MATSPRVSRVIEAWVDPEIAFVELLAKEENAAWLDAGINVREGWSYLCMTGSSAYTLVGTPSVKQVAIAHLATARSARVTGSILEALESVTLPTQLDEDRASDESFSTDRFDLGWVGWVGFESGASAIGVDFADSTRPDSAMLFVDRLVAFDHDRGRMVLSTFSASGSGWLDHMERQLRRLVGAVALPLDTDDSTLAIGELRHTPSAYRSMILECQSRIAAGDAYQLCLTNQIAVKTRADPTTVYRRLRRTNPTPRGGLIKIAGLALASSSPELFLGVRTDGLIETRPIKGTRPRSAASDVDALLRRQLLESEKERAENVMIVDLMRNDLSRVAVLGSVQVPHLFTVEPYANVFQLVSTVTARLAPGVSPMTVVRSAFPAGSMSGAPKFSAMTILAGLERGPRGAYAGAFGYIGIGGSIRLSMTIRTVVIDRAHEVATIGTGGGITILSDPDEEIAEMLLKPAPVLTALGARLDIPIWTAAGNDFFR
ncbi:anthranilate synthase component I family protein [Naasia lichenicola]|uniref:Anthranilate synthase component I family protein n=1 Tax=Naasia lichenicola TaxID=2565933 RepID=A0A4S4FJH0_9MICO|nr:anthranilate synthase component I family protein [Naasia lichenicola]